MQDEAALQGATEQPASFDKLKDDTAAEGETKKPITPVGKAWKRLKGIRDKIYYGDVLPPVGSQQLSYARFLEMLAEREIKRVTLLDQGKIAFGGGHLLRAMPANYDAATYDRQDEECVKEHPAHHVPHNHLQNLLIAYYCTWPPMSEGLGIRPGCSLVGSPITCCDC